jgi:hypothetical protein
MINYQVIIKVHLTQASSKSELDLLYILTKIKLKKSTFVFKSPVNKIHADKNDLQNRFFEFTREATHPCASVGEILLI